MQIGPIQQSVRQIYFPNTEILSNSKEFTNTQWCTILKNLICYKQCTRYKYRLNWMHDLWEAISYRSFRPEKMKTIPLSSYQHKTKVYHDHKPSRGTSQNKR